MFQLMEDYILQSVVQLHQWTNGKRKMAESYHNGLSLLKYLRSKFNEAPSSSFGWQWPCWKQLVTGSTVLKEPLTTTNTQHKKEQPTPNKNPPPPLVSLWIMELGPWGTETSLAFDGHTGGNGRWLCEFGEWKQAKVYVGANSLMYTKLNTMLGALL